MSRRPVIQSRFITTICLVILFGLLTSVSADEINWRRFAGTTIRGVVGPGVWYQGAYKPLTPEFEKLTGITVQFEVMPTAQRRQKTEIALAAKSDAFDFFEIQMGQRGRKFTLAEYLEPIEKYINDPSLTPADWDYEDFAEGCRATTIVYEGQPLNNLVYSGQSQMLFYRKDLFEKYQVKKPETLEELEEAAKKLTLDTDGDGKIDLYGFISRGKGWSTTATFATYLWNFGGSWVTPDGKPGINTPQAIQALGFYSRMLRNYAPPGILGIGDTEAQPIFQAGKVAMHSELNQNIFLYEDPKNSRVAGKVGVMLVPKGPAGSYVNLPTTSMGISAYSKNKEATWLYLAWLFNKENMLKMLLDGLPVCRKSAWENPDFKPINQEWAAASLEALRRGIDIAKPPLVAVNEARDIVGQVIQAAIRGEPIKPAADEGARKLAELLEREKNLKP